MTIIKLPADAVFVKDGDPVTTSLRVAEIFGKQHKHVLDKIRALIAECPPEFSRPNFRPVEYLDPKGEIQPVYELTHDGFTLLAMGFTGPKALTFKLAYIERFNSMAAAQHHSRKLPPVAEPMLTPAEVDAFMARPMQMSVLDYLALKQGSAGAPEGHRYLTHYTTEQRAEFIRLADDEGMGPTEIAEITGANPDGVRSVLFRARKKGKAQPGKRQGNLWSNGQRQRQPTA